MHGHFLGTGSFPEVVEPLHLVREEEVFRGARTRSVVLGRDELHLLQLVGNFLGHITLFSKILKALDGQVLRHHFLLLFLVFWFLWGIIVLDVECVRGRRLLLALVDRCELLLQVGELYQVVIHHLVAKSLLEPGLVVVEVVNDVNLDIMIIFLTWSSHNAATVAQSWR